MTDRDKILNRTNGGYDVFVHYLGEDCKKNVFKNPFRKDSNPSCHLYYHSDKNGGEGRYILKDFGDSQWKGDCFWLVGHIACLDIKTQFNEILNTIDKELDLFILDNDTYNKRTFIPKVNNTPKERDPRPMKFVPCYRNFNKYELGYWNKYGIGLDTLEKFNVRCLKECYFERPDKTGFNVKGNSEIPMFGYTFNNGEGIKVYRPGAESCRFLYAGKLPKPYIFGLDQLDDNKNDILLITGGEKDVMSLSAKGFQGISLNSETAKISNFLFNKITLFKNIVFLYDSDETGVRESELRVKELKEMCLNSAGKNIKVVRVVLPLAGTKKEKDISDFFMLGHSGEELRELINVEINKVI